VTHRPGHPPKCNLYPRITFQLGLWIILGKMPVPRSEAESDETTPSFRSKRSPGDEPLNSRSSLRSEGESDETASAVPLRFGALNLNLSS
jgi:hypothetical protein